MYFVSSFLACVLVVLITIDPLLSSGCSIDFVELHGSLNEVSQSVIGLIWLGYRTLSPRVRVNIYWLFISFNHFRYKFDLFWMNLNFSVNFWAAEINFVTTICIWTTISDRKSWLDHWRLDLWDFSFLHNVIDLFVYSLRHDRSHCIEF